MADRQALPTILSCTVDHGTIAGAGCTDVTVQYRDARGTHEIIVRLHDGDVRLHGGVEPIGNDGWWAVVDAANEAVNPEPPDEVTRRVPTLTLREAGAEAWRGLAERCGAVEQ